MARKTTDKAPAFQLYARDWAFGTMHLTLEQQGAYLRLLTHQWIEGAIPADPASLARLLGITPGAMKRLWPGLETHFPTARDGTVRLNRRLERERVAMLERAAERSAIGKRGASVRYASGTPEALPNTMPKDAIAVAVAVSSSGTTTTRQHAAADFVREHLTEPTDRQAFDGHLRASRNPEALATTVRGLAPGGIEAMTTWPVLGRALREAALLDGRLTANMLRACIRKLQEPPRIPRGHGSQQARNLAVIAAHPDDEAVA